MIENETKSNVKKVPRTSVLTEQMLKTLYVRTYQRPFPDGVIVKALEGTKSTEPSLYFSFSYSRWHLKKTLQLELSDEEELDSPIVRLDALRNGGGATSTSVSNVTLPTWLAEDSSKLSLSQLEKRIIDNEDLLNRLLTDVEQCRKVRKDRLKTETADKIESRKKELKRQLKELQDMDMEQNDWTRINALQLWFFFCK